MTKRLLLLTIAATVSASSARAQSTFRDVPDNHWAAAAVKRLAKAGIIIGRPAGSTSTDNTNDKVPKAAFVAPLIKSALMANAVLSQQNVNVDVISPTKSNRGTVTLVGAVQNEAQRTLAATIARVHAPNYKIINQLKIMATRSIRKR